MKDYHAVGIVLAVLIMFAIGFEWYMFQRSRRATRENRCQLCGQTLPTKDGEK
jgi:cbb3-type cytochrome oxidase subunit 3